MTKNEQNNCIDYNNLTAFLFEDSEGTTLAVTNAGNYTVIQDLVTKFRQIAGYEDGSFEGEDYDYTFDDFCRFAEDKGYFVDVPQAMFSINF